MLFLTQKLVFFILMATNEDINTGIAEILETPERNFSTHPLSQPEILGVIEYLLNAVNDVKTNETLAQYYISIINFLKTKVLYN